MKHLAIIGAGQLGSRHLQALATLPVACDITVIDPVQASLEVARQRFEELERSPTITAVHYAQEMNALPAHLDYAIIATTADVRLQVLRSLLNGRSVAALLLEKVLFQHAGEYAQARDLLSASNTRAWVNCPRRLFPVYRDLSDFFAQERLLSFSTTGGGWGLGCNSIHFIDLFAQFARAVPEQLDGRDLDQGLIPSKRANFKEFTGTLRGMLGRARFDITSFADSSARLLTTIRAEKRACVVDEGAGKAFLFDGESWHEKLFRTPFLSQLGGAIATDILTTGECGLTSFADSVAYHLPLLQCLGAHASAADGTDPSFFPVT